MPKVLKPEESLARTDRILREAIARREDWVEQLPTASLLPGVEATLTSYLSPSSVSEADSEARSDTSSNRRDPLADLLSCKDGEDDEERDAAGNFKYGPWPKSIMRAFYLASLEDPRNENIYNGAYNLLLNYVFPREKGFIVHSQYTHYSHPKYHEDTRRVGLIDFTTTYVVKQGQVAVFFLELKREMDFHREASRIDAVEQIVKRYRILQSNSKVEAIHAISAFGRSIAHFSAKRDQILGPNVFDTEEDATKPVDPSKAGVSRWPVNIVESDGAKVFMSVVKEVMNTAQAATAYEADGNSIIEDANRRGRQFLRKAEEAAKIIAEAQRKSRAASLKRKHSQAQTPAASRAASLSRSLTQGRYEDSQGSGTQSPLRQSPRLLAMNAIRAALQLEQENRPDPSSSRLQVPRMTRSKSWN